MRVPRLLEPVILASASPRRRDILERMGLVPEIRPSLIAEPEFPGLAPSAAAERLATMKARSVAGTLEAGTVIGADTVVAVDGMILGKPESAEDARRILSFLSGKVQDVITGLCLVHRPSGLELSGFEKTRVHSKPMTAEEIDDYIATGECFGKAGAYAIQETGDRFVERIEGSFDNVVGFPSALFSKLLRDLVALVEAERSSKDAD
jgi:septum formation protein